MSEQQVTVSAEWLLDHLNDEGLVVIDGSWHLPPEKRNPRAEYESEHIPGAVFFDLDKHSNQDAALSHMMPSAKQFGEEMGALGLSDTDTLVIYDTTGLFSAARIWWMFRQFGARKTYLLDGGLPAWKKAGGSVEAGTATRAPTTFNASLSPDTIVALEQMREAVESDDGPLLLDARGAGRFYGREPEPKASLKSGHMPGAVNLPYTKLLDDEKKLLPAAQIQDVLNSVGYDPSKPTIATCGSGVTACVILLGLARLGHENVPLYDGSWSEWGALEDTPTATE